jgi:GMP synthase (glutamine-hydrolysing)
MKPILLVRNDRYESFGVAPGALARAGVDILTFDATLPGMEMPPLEDVAGVVTFGGTMNVNQVDEYPYLARVIGYTSEAIQRGVPYLGICLGSQILARASGADVVQGSVREVGFEPVRPTPDASQDPLLSFLGDREMVLQWHEDTHELPAGAALLMKGDRIPVQGYRVGDRAWGIQFHLEVDMWELDWWLDASDAQVDLKTRWGKSSAEIRAESGLHMIEHQERGREIFRRFADVARTASSTPR